MPALPLVRQGGQWPKTVIPPFVVGLFPSPTAQMAASRLGSPLIFEIWELLGATVVSLNLLPFFMGS